MSTIIVLSFAASFTACYFATPTIFGGRDQGAIATAAINLAKNKSFKFSTPVSRDLFQKYGPGRALNYPGFDYTSEGKLTSRFPKLYTAYLAGAYALFGLEGIQYANLIPLFLFLALFWLTLRQFFSEKISFLGFLIAATFFPFLWFAKYTLTEIFMLALVWAGIYFLIIFCRCPTPTDRGVRHLQIALLAFALSALTRIEGIVFFLLAVVYIFALQKKRNIQIPKNFKKYLLISTLFLIIAYLFLNYPALSDSAKNIVKTFLSNSEKESAPSASLYAHLAKIFFSYNILVYVVLGLAGIGWLAGNLKANWTKPEFLPIFLTFPLFFYLISPQITLDDPWLLRRFAFAVFPALIFYSIYFSNKFFRHRVFLYIILAGIIGGNIAVSQKFLAYSENKNLLSQTEKISQKFGPNDLILVDRLATGSGFSLMSEPLNTIYGKNAVYFFSAEDLKYINRNQYKNIYLLAPAGEKSAWYDSLSKELAGTFTIQNNFLEPSKKGFGLAENVDIITINGIWKINI